MFFAWIWPSPSPPNSPCPSHAELSFETNSWACVHVCQLGSYLVFQSQLASAPLGVLSAWEDKGSPGARPLHTANTVHVWVKAWSICYQELLRHTVGLLMSVSMCLVFIPLDPNSQFLTPDTGSWFEKNKTRSTPKHSCKHVYVENPTAYQTTMILSWKHFYVTFISIFSYPSAGSPHPGGLSLTERQILLN